MSKPSDNMGIITLLAFFLLTNALVWGGGWILLNYRAEVEAFTGMPIGYRNPAFIALVWTPSISAFVLITLRYGAKGVGSFLRRFTFWKMHWAWWAFLLFGYPIAAIIGAALNGTLADPFPFSPWTGILPILGMTLLTGPMEEFGWRGFGLPILQRYMAPFWATLILGAVWALWHYPAFIIPGTPQYGSPFVIFFFAVLFLSFPFTSLVNASRGSILMPFLLHFQANNDALPDAGAWALLTMVVFAVLVVWVDRRKMFSRQGGETEIFAS